MPNLFDAPFAVGDKIVSTCGSLYRGQKGIVTDAEEWDLAGEMTDRDGWHFSVIIACNGMTHKCGFCTSQMILEAQDKGREYDKPCEQCCCTLGGHGRESGW